MNLSINPVIQEDIEQIVSVDLPWDTLKDATVLVTGASGMLPSYVVYTLLGLNDKLNSNIKVIGLVRNEEKARKILRPILHRSDFRLITQDITKPLEIEEELDYIFHGGSAAKPKEHGLHPSLTMKSNILGTFNLLDLAVEKKCKAFVFFSSSEIYGDMKDQTQPIQETQYGVIDLLNPRSCYSEGKRACETICASYQSECGIRCVLPRFAHIYGPGLSLDDGRVQADFAANIIRNQNISMNSDGSSIRAYTYISDAISGLFFALLKGKEMAYNIADTNRIVSIRQLAEAFVSARPEKRLVVEFKVPEHQKGIYNPTQFIGLDNSKLSALGWTANVNLDSGVDRMLTYYEKSEFAE